MYQYQIPQEQIPSHANPNNSERQKNSARSRGESLDYDRIHNMLNQYKQSKTSKIENQLSQDKKQKQHINQNQFQSQNQNQHLLEINKNLQDMTDLQFQPQFNFKKIDQFQNQSQFQKKNNNENTNFIEQNNNIQNSSHQQYNDNDEEIYNTNNKENQQKIANLQEKDKQQEILKQDLKNQIKQLKSLAEQKLNSEQKICSSFKKQTFSQQKNILNQQLQSLNQKNNSNQEINQNNDNTIEINNEFMQNQVDLPYESQQMNDINNQQDQLCNNFAQQQIQDINQTQNDNQIKNNQAQNYISFQFNQPQQQCQLFNQNQNQNENFNYNQYEQIYQNCDENHIQEQENIVKKLEFQENLQNQTQIGKIDNNQINEYQKQLNISSEQKQDKQQNDNFQQNDKLQDKIQNNNQYQNDQNSRYQKQQQQQQFIEFSHEKLMKLISPSISSQNSPLQKQHNNKNYQINQNFNNQAKISHRSQRSHTNFQEGNNIFQSIDYQQKQFQIQNSFRERRYNNSVQVQPQQNLKLKQNLRTNSELNSLNLSQILFKQQNKSQEKGNLTVGIQALQQKIPSLFDREIKQQNHQQQQNNQSYIQSDNSFNFLNMSNINSNSNNVDNNINQQNDNCFKKSFVKDNNEFSNNHNVSQTQQSEIDKFQSPMNISIKNQSMNPKIKIEDKLINSAKESQGTIEIQLGKSLKPTLDKTKNHILKMLLQNQQLTNSSIQQKSHQKQLNNCDDDNDSIQRNQNQDEKKENELQDKKQNSTNQNTELNTNNHLSSNLSLAQFRKNSENQIIVHDKKIPQQKQQLYDRQNLKQVLNQKQKQNQSLNFQQEIGQSQKCSNNNNQIDQNKNQDTLQDNNQIQDQTKQESFREQLQKYIQQNQILKTQYSYHETLKSQQLDSDHNFSGQNENLNTYLKNNNISNDQQNLSQNYNQKMRSQSVNSISNEQQKKVQKNFFIQAALAKKFKENGGDFLIEENQMKVSRNSWKFGENINQRNQMWLENVKNKNNDLKKQIFQKEYEECTFQPKLNQLNKSYNYKKHAQTVNNSRKNSISHNNIPKPQIKNQERKCNDNQKQNQSQINLNNQKQYLSQNQNYKQQYQKRLQFFQNKERSNSLSTFKKIY
ncbi:hypothetical protein PPERSA_00097 [Pseudocohnilembus persalinus]|uniref:Uncharacterized protein n=1 Tax=Pseudocohnilembus persalinus TaxID=266149 RepID=A0A0V0Q7N6_PSEPJ|nr:hypothetical protein PPERSA_00097 [Pseudocohnilembus persalinus]|eukprot:KRW98214.1 hypothetical protein PPERSA_00097 [Pseudocohnilembus persalinus]